MHRSVMDWLRERVEELGFAPENVLEVGSLNVNGSARSLFPHSMYYGIDIQDGDGVDEVLDASELPDVYPERFDLVVCTEMMEHAENWRGAIEGMKEALKDGGILLLTARGPGFGRHEYPGDYWRFTKRDMERIFADMSPRVWDDPQHPGVFVYAVKSGELYVSLDEIEVASVD